RCWDWLLLPAGSNTHFAKNRASFATYRRAPCRIANQRVLGVGTVQLRVRRAPDDARTTTLVLRDVLHMPQARWNGISVRRASTTSTISSCGGGGGDEDRGEGLWFAEGRPERGCSRVVLAGEHHHPMPDVGELVDEKMLKGLVVSKEELELLNERVR
ncbi:hypothetical protein BO99DRAFT_304530, partial [Aspergillus violaceofuscus CBS 115571]